MQKPCVYIRSSSLGIDQAKVLQSLLNKSTESTVWDQDVVKKQEFMTDRLLRICNEYDFITFIFCHDDFINKNDSFEELVWEYGFIYSVVGKERVSAIVSYEGLGNKKYFPVSETQPLIFQMSRSDHNWNAALQPTADSLLHTIRMAGVRSSRNSKINNLLHYFNNLINSCTILDIRYDSLINNLLSSFESGEFCEPYTYNKIILSCLLTATLFKCDQNLVKLSQAGSSNYYSNIITSGEECQSKGLNSYIFEAYKGGYSTDLQLEWDQSYGTDTIYVLYYLIKLDRAPRYLLALHFEMISGNAWEGLGKKVLSSNKHVLKPINDLLLYMISTKGGSENV